jgi:hypothetical protein
VVDAAEPGDRAGFEEQALGQAGLTGVDVRENADVQGFSRAWEVLWDAVDRPGRTVCRRIGVSSRWWTLVKAKIAARRAARNRF